MRGNFGAGLSGNPSGPWVQSLYHTHYRHDARAFIELLQYRRLHQISSTELCACVEQLSRRYPSNVSNEHIIALQGNQPPVIKPISEPDDISLRSMENLQELAAMMGDYSTRIY